MESTGVYWIPVFQILEARGFDVILVNARHVRSVPGRKSDVYDLSSSYFEGHCCPLARRGHSRDGKRGTLQIVFGLLCTAAGCPIAVEVFEGSTGDPKTVAAQVDKIRNRFGLKRVVLVGDRGMLTGARIREDLQGIDGLRWITTLRAPTIRKLIAAGRVTPSLFDERDLAEISSPDFPGERLIVCRNPVLAEQRRRKRLELLAATEEKLAPIVTATQRAKEPLRGAGEIGIRVGKVINQHKVEDLAKPWSVDNEVADVRANRPSW